MDLAVTQDVRSPKTRVASGHAPTKYNESPLLTLTSRQRRPKHASLNGPPRPPFMVCSPRAQRKM